MREWMEPQYGHLFVGLVITGLYYLAASIVFPTSSDSAADFDEHFFAHRRRILGAIAFCNMTAFVWHDLMHFDQLPARWLFIVPTYFVLIGVAIVAKSKRLSLAALIGLIGFYVVLAAATFVVA